MKLLHLLFLFSFPALFSGETGVFLTIKPSGEFCVDGMKFDLVHFGINWNKSVQSAKSIVPVSPPLSTPGLFRLDADFKAVNGQFRLNETVKTPKRNRADFHLSLNAPSAIFTNDLAIQFILPCRLYRNKPVTADGKSLNFGAVLDGKDKVRRLRVKELRLPLKRGMLAIRGNFLFQLQDNRQYLLDNWSARILFDRKTPEVRNTALSFSLEYTPYREEKLDLQSHGQTGKHCRSGTLPHGNAEFAGIGFNALEFPVSVSGGMELILPQPVCTQYLYILHAVRGGTEKDEIGSILCEYADAVYVEKNEQLFPVRKGIDITDFRNPQKTANSIPGWQQRSGNGTIGFSVTRYPLSGRPVKRLKFEKRDGTEWLIQGITFSDRWGVDVPERPVTTEASANWIALKNSKTVRPGSILDFSGLLDAPAGKYGFARNRNGRIEFEKRPGIPRRFYGINLAFSTNFMEKEVSDELADQLAKNGYNLVRLHHFDRDLVLRRGGNCTDLHPERLDRMDYLLSTLKRRGIYTTLDLFMIREIAAGEFPENADWKPTAPEFKALIFISDSAMRNYQTFTENLLNHKNPYTGLAWKEDPAILTISMINESTIFHTAFRTPAVAGLYQKKFRLWLNKHKFVPNDRTLPGYQRRFLAEIYHTAFAKLQAFYRRLGVKIMLTDQNYTSTPAVSLMRENYDFVDNHFYWAHPQFLEKDWTLPASFMNMSSINREAGGLNRMFPTRLFGKPFSISEWDYVNPNEFAAEGAFLTGAYAALQDWSILCRFVYANKPEVIHGDHSPLGFFKIANDPVRRLSELAGVVAFLRGDVRSSNVAFPFLLKRDCLNDPETPESYPPLMNRLGLIGKTGTLFTTSGAPLFLPKNTRALFGLVKTDKKFSVPFMNASSSLETLRKHGILSAEEYDPSRKRFSSSTGELFLDSGSGSFQSITPRSESFVMRSGTRLSGKFAEIVNGETWGAFLIASRDASPLQTSERILLLHLTTARNSGQRFRNAELNCLEVWGKTPLLLRHGTAEMRLNRKLSGFRLYAVSLDGIRLFEIPMKFRNEQTVFALNNIKGILAYELIKTGNTVSE